MDNIWAFLGGFGISVAAITWLIKSITIHLLGKDLESYKTKIKYESEHANQLLLQKVDLYTKVADPIIEVITKTNYTKKLNDFDFDKFDKDRMSTTTLLAMFAPTEVYDGFNELVDYIYDVRECNLQWDFHTFRQKSEAFVSNVRKDIGLHRDNIVYKGIR